MSLEDRFPAPPAIRLELTQEQAEALDRAKPPGASTLILGYARRHPWPGPSKFTVCAWFADLEAVKAALVEAGIMAPEKHRPKPTTRKKAAPRTKTAD